MLVRLLMICAWPRSSEHDRISTQLRRPFFVGVTEVGMNQKQFESWARRVLCDTGMPVICIAGTYDTVFCYHKYATAHERLAIIARYPVFIDMMNIVV